MSLSDLTSPTAIKLAIAESDRLGRERFLARYGFGLSREFVLRYEGNDYDSKAIVGVAHGIQNPELGQLESFEFSGGRSGAAKRAFDLGFDIEGLHRRPTDWTLHECEIAVQAYFDCLSLKLQGKPFNRAKACRDVAVAIGRTRGSVDYKFQNIDAWLLENGLPRMMNAVAPNKQKLLGYVALDPLSSHYAVFELTRNDIRPLHKTESLIVDAPAAEFRLLSETSSDTPRARKVDFAKRDAKNRRLGRAGEQWVVEFEKTRLSEVGRSDLAGKIDTVSERLGDGLGYDLVSFDEHGNELFIEVKTTNAGITTPFFISPNELAASKKLGRTYRLYRIFEFSTEPRLYILQGSLESQLHLKTQAYSALPK